MKVKVLLSIVLLMGAMSVFAQKETLRQGSLVYEMEKGIIVAPTVIAKRDAKCYLDANIACPESLRSGSLFKSLFSESRAKELADVRVSTVLSINTVKNEVLRVQFAIYKDNHLVTNKNDLPLTLAELAAMESRIKATKFNISVIDSKVITQLVYFQLPIDFYWMYKY